MEYCANKRQNENARHLGCMECDPKKQVIDDKLYCKYEEIDHYGNNRLHKLYTKSWDRHYLAQLQGPIKCNGMLFCGSGCYYNYLKIESDKFLCNLSKFPDNQTCNRCYCCLIQQSYHGNPDKMFDKDPCYISLVGGVKLWFCSFHCRDPYIKVTEFIQSEDKLMKFVYKKLKSKNFKGRSSKNKI